MRRTVAIVVLGLAGLLAALIGSGLALRLVAGRGPTGLDRTVTRWFVDLRTPGLTDAAKAVQFLGRSEFLFAVVAIAGVMLATRYARAGVLLFLACLGAETMVDVVKPIVDRLRPPPRLWLEVTGRDAFPSGHALISTAIALGVVATIGVAIDRRPPPWAWAVAGVVAAVIGLSRVYLGVHWITDVVAGWAAGGAWVLLLTVALRRSREAELSPTP